MSNTVDLAQCLNHFGAEFLQTHSLSSEQAKVWRAIVNCHTPALGGHRLECDACGYSKYIYHACRNRHCPQCQARTKDAWTQARLTELLPTPYAHMVFTLPHELNALTALHDQWVYDTVFTCVAQTLTEFAHNPRWLGATPAFTLVLHTWTQDLRRHVHIHAVISCGGLDAENNWIAPKRQPQFLFPVHALSKVFRAKFLKALDAAHQQQKLPRDPEAGSVAWQKRRKALLKHDWVVYAKTPLGGAAEVLEYLSRYTHRTAISNERIVAIQNDQVLLRVRADANGGKRIIRLPGTTFIHRFLQHVLPPGFKRVRHYGLLSPACKTKALSAARHALNAPEPNPVAQEDAEQFMRRVAQLEISRCPCCEKGRLQSVEILQPKFPAGSMRILAQIRHNNRGPPE